MSLRVPAGETDHRTSHQIEPEVMPDDETIMPSDVGAEESTPQPNGSASESGSPPKEAPPEEEQVPWATSHFEVMMGKPLYGALLDAETDDLITQVKKRDSTSIHDLRERDGLTGEITYLTEDGDGNETRIELSLKQSAEGEEDTQQSETEKLVGALREEIRAMNSSGSERDGPAPDADKDDLWDQIETLRDRLSKMRDKNQDLLDEIDEAEGKLRKVRNEKRGEISQLRDQREELRVKTQQLKRERDKLQRQLDDAEEREEELEETVTSLRDRNDRLKSRVANVGDEDSGASEGFWAMLFERLLGEDGMLSEIDGTAIGRVMTQLSQQQAQSQPQQVPAGAAAQIQGGAGAAQPQGAAGPVHRAGQQAQTQGQQQGHPQGQPAAQTQGQPSGSAPQQQSSNQSEEMMDRDQAIADLFKRIIEDSIGRLQGGISEQEIQESSDLVGQRLEEYRSQQGFQIQPHEWAQLMWELTAAVERMEVEGDVGMVFCHKLWPMLLTFSDQLQVVDYMPADQAATTLQNFYESSDNMLLGNRIEITGSMIQILTRVIEVLKSHLGTGERPGGVPSGSSSESSGGGEEPGEAFPGEANDTPPGL